ncbi:beta-glucanase [Folsomia candida]|uniref:beta-glucanase n=1 Tax=Folsomia candida TaxID=158441 RepID=UPI000B8F723C|nr:beta-glucanase [Folsomia candida]
MNPIFILCAFAHLGVVHGYWHLAWEDQFDGANLADRWDFDTGCSGFGNNELQCYTNNRRENANQQGGILTITARKEWWGDGVHGDKQFTSTRMKTKANWLHGKFEIRARLPKGKHLWPAIWMMPARSEYGDWPRSGEIDIMEYRGQLPNQDQGTLHFGQAWNNKGQVGSGERNFPVDFSQDFHTFGLDWSPWQIQWILDGAVFHTETLQKNFWPGLYTKNGQPFDKNFYLIINLAVGGSFFGNEPFDPKEADSWAKNTLEVDWVKKWEWR